MVHVSRFLPRSNPDSAGPTPKVIHQIGVMHSYQDLSLRSLQRALELSDGPAQLAADLRLTVFDLKSMLERRSNVPSELFLKVVDLLYPCAERRARVRIAEQAGKADQVTAGPAHRKTGRRSA